MATEETYPGAGKYAGIEVEGKDIPQDEPLFLLRAQDVFAPDAVEGYATLLAAAAATAHPSRRMALSQQSSDVRAFADRMRRWQHEHRDRVKVPD